MLKVKVIPLYEQVARRIEQQIEEGLFAPGDRIHTIREICEKFEVSDVTAKQALRKLNARGIIQSIAGSGAYVSDRSKNNDTDAAALRQRVAFLKIGLRPASVFAYGIDLIQQELADLDYTMMYNVASRDDQIGEVIDQIAQSNPAAMVLFPPHHGDFEQAGYMTRVRRQRFPTLIVETQSKRDAFVSSDIFHAAGDLLDHLYELGHRNICLATAYAPKVAGFKAAAARWQDPNLKIQIMDCGDKPGQATYHLGARLLALNPRPTGIIAGDDHASAMLISRFLSEGLSIPHDISVVGFDDHPDLARLSPLPVTVIRHPFREIAQEVALWCQANITHQESVKKRRRLIRGTFIQRDSSGPPPETPESPKSPAASKSRKTPKISSSKKGL